MCWISMQLNHSIKDHFIFYSRLVGDVLLATGFLSYSGPFNQNFRTKLKESWEKVLYQKKIPYSDNLNITSMLVDNATVCIPLSYSKMEYIRIR